MKAADLDTILTALADPTRRGVVDLLRRRPRRAGELAEACQLTPPAMSRHLKLSRRSGFVEEQRDEQDARVRVYRLRQKPFVALRVWLDQVDAFWGEHLGAFRDHAKKRRRAEKKVPAEPKAQGKRRSKR